MFHYILPRGARSIKVIYSLAFDVKLDEWLTWIAIVKISTSKLDMPVTVIYELRVGLYEAS